MTAKTYSYAYSIEAVKLEIDTVLFVDVQADGDVRTFLSHNSQFISIVLIVGVGYIKLFLKRFVLPTNPAKLPKWQFRRQ